MTYARVNVYSSSFTNLSQTAKLLVGLLDKTRYDHRESWLATRTLAEKLCRSVRTIQLALNELKTAGLINVVKDYTIRTRRRIVLLWRAQPAPKPEDLSAKNDDSLKPVFALRSSPPLYPPIKKSPEGDLKIESGGRPPTPPPSSLETPPEAAPEQIRTVVDKAAKVLGSDAGIYQRVLGLAKRFGLPWVGAAFDRAIQKQASQVLTSPMGYVTRTLEGFREEGGPPPGLRKLTPEEQLAERKRKGAALMAAIAERAAARKEPHIEF